MSWNFYTNESIEEPFVHDVGRFMNAIENPRKFNGRVAYQKGECPVCKRKTAVLGFSPRTNTWMMACPVQVCGLRTMTLHMRSRVTFQPSRRTGDVRDGLQRIQETGYRSGTERGQCQRVIKKQRQVHVFERCVAPSIDSYPLI